MLHPRASQRNALFQKQFFFKKKCIISIVACLKMKINYGIIKYRTWDEIQTVVLLMDLIIKSLLLLYGLEVKLERAKRLWLI